MNPATAPDVQVYAGDSTSFHQYTLKEGATPVDLVTAGWTAWVAVWRPHPNSDVQIVLTVDSSRAAEGIIAVSCTPAQATAMGTGGVWDLQATRGSEVRTFIAGKTLWRRDIARV